MHLGLTIFLVSDGLLGMPPHHKPRSLFIRQANGGTCPLLWMSTQQVTPGSVPTTTQSLKTRAQEAPTTALLLWIQKRGGQLCPLPVTESV